MPHVLRVALDTPLRRLFDYLEPEAGGAADRARNAGAGALRTPAPDRAWSSPPPRTPRSRPSGSSPSWRCSIRARCSTPRCSSCSAGRRSTTTTRSGRCSPPRCPRRCAWVRRPRRARNAGWPRPTGAAAWAAGEPRRAPKQRALLGLLAAGPATAAELEERAGVVARGGARPAGPRLHRAVPRSRRRAPAGGATRARGRSRAAARTAGRGRRRSRRALGTVRHVSCCTASPAAARPRCTCGSSSRCWSGAAARWCWCRRSASRRSWSAASGSASTTPLAVLHSALTDHERLQAWRDAHQRRGAHRARHALGGVRTRAGLGLDHRRRGARRVLQAARGRLPLLGARPGGGARAAGRRAGAARLRHPLARDAAQRHRRPLHAPGAAAARRRGAAAAC